MRHDYLVLLDEWVKTKTGTLSMAEMRDYLRQHGADEIEAHAAVKDFWRLYDARRAEYLTTLIDRKPGAPDDGT